MKQNMLKMLYCFLIGLFTLSQAAYAEMGTTEFNTELVKQYYKEVLEKHNVDALDELMKASYIQHNPHVQDGREAVKGFFRSFFEKLPDAKFTVKRIIAEGELVVVHSHFTASADDRGIAVVDIYRIEDGKLAEHWDVAQPVPEESANENTMF